MASWYRFFKPSVPLAARGGIKSRSKRGTFGESWWAKRWLVVLGGFNLGARLARGRSYARRGQVLDITIEKGCVRARVQGSRPTPYAVTLKVKALGAAQWAKVVAALAREARFAAKLLASEMPEDVESAFRGASLSLFPERQHDLRTECSCPDWSNPCKHIAAVYYLLGEEFDRDPFLIFRLRGMTREELLRALGGAAHAPAPARRSRGTHALPVEARAAPEPLQAEMHGFWNGAPLPEDLLGDVRVPTASAALLTQLGEFPFWRGAETIVQSVEGLYEQAAPRGLSVFVGLREGEDANTTPAAARPPLLVG